MVNLTEALIRKTLKEHGFKVVKQTESYYRVQPKQRYMELFKTLPVNTKLICIHDGFHEWGVVTYLSHNNFSSITMSPELIQNNGEDYLFSRNVIGFIPFEWLFPKKNHLPKWF